MSLTAFSVIGVRCFKFDGPLLPACHPRRRYVARTSVLKATLPCWACAFIPQCARRDGRMIKRRMVVNGDAALLAISFPVSAKGVPPITASMAELRRGSTEKLSHLQRSSGQLLPRRRGSAEYPATGSSGQEWLRGTRFLPSGSAARALQNSSSGAGSWTRRPDAV